jgi:hypothetical protein
MLSSVADVIAALNVRLSVVESVMIAAVAVIPSRSVVHAGMPLHVTGWLKTIVAVDPVLATLTILTGVAFFGLTRPRVFLRGV